MKKWIFIAVFFIPLLTTAQEFYWIFLADKNTDTRPSLSQKAIDRRLRQNIDLDLRDFPVKEDYLHAIRGMGVEIKGSSRWLNAVYAALTVEQKSKIDQLEFVVSIQKSERIALLSEYDIQRQNDVEVNSQPDFYGAAKEQFEMIRAEWFHAENWHGEGITVALFDGGFSNADSLDFFRHIFESGRFMGAVDLVADSTVFGFSSHGTLVWSPMAARDSGIYSGLATESNYWLFRTEDVGSEKHIEEYNWLAAAEFADSVGVDIINSSLGYTRFDMGQGDYSYSDMDGATAIVTRAADWAASKGILVVSSNGNYYNDGWTYMGAPADGDSVLSVGAVDSDRRHASFSSIGPTFDGRIKPDVAAMGQQTVLVHPFGNVVVGNGTSFSSPIIAAACAALWAEFPYLSAWDVRNAVVKSADRYNRPDEFTGYGIPNFKFAEEILRNEVQASPPREIMIYPNPFSDHFQIFFGSAIQAEKVEVRIMNQLGQVVFFETFPFEYFLHINSIDHLSKGVYYLDISADDHFYQMKIISATDEK